MSEFRYRHRMIIQIMPAAEWIMRWEDDEHSGHEPLVGWALVDEWRCSRFNCEGTECMDAAYESHHPERIVVPMFYEASGDGEGEVVTEMIANGQVVPKDVR